MKRIEVVAAIIRKDGKIFATQRGYGDFKLAVGETVADSLESVRSEFARLSADKKYLEEMMAKGASEAARASSRTMSKVMKKVGFTDVRY